MQANLSFRFQCLVADGAMLPWLPNVQRTFPWRCSWLHRSQWFSSCNFWEWHWNWRCLGCIFWCILRYLCQTEAVGWRDELGVFLNCVKLLAFHHISVFFSDSWCGNPCIIINHKPYCMNKCNKCELHPAFASFASRCLWVDSSGPSTEIFWWIKKSHV